MNARSGAAAGPARDRGVRAHDGASGGRSAWMTVAGGRWIRVVTEGNRLPPLRRPTLTVCSLFANAEAADQLRVARRVFVLQVVEQPAALADQLQQAAP